MINTPLKLQYNHSYNSLLVVDSFCNNYLYDSRESKLKSLKLMKPATMAKPSIFEVNNHSLFLMDADNQAVLFDIRMAAESTFKQFNESFSACCFYDNRYLAMADKNIDFIDQADLSTKERIYEGNDTIKSINCNDSTLVAGGFNCNIQVK